MKRKSPKVPRNFRIEPSINAMLGKHAKRHGRTETRTLEMAITLFCSLK